MVQCEICKHRYVTEKLPSGRERAIQAFLEPTTFMQRVAAVYNRLMNRLK